MGIHSRARPTIASLLVFVNFFKVMFIFFLKICCPIQTKFGIWTLLLHLTVIDTAKALIIAYT